MQRRLMMNINNSSYQKSDYANATLYMLQRRWIDYHYSIYQQMLMFMLHAEKMDR
jgi:hypothetical protein